MPLVGDKEIRNAGTTPNMPQKIGDSISFNLVVDQHKLIFSAKLFIIEIKINRT